jgi:hypothetical protein
MTTTPGPVARPLETVSPEPSACSRMPPMRRPLSIAATPWAPSWAIVTTCRATPQVAGNRTTAAAIRAESQIAPVSGAGWLPTTSDHTCCSPSPTPSP